MEPGRVIKPWASRLAWSLWAIVLMGLFSLVILSRLLLPGVLTPDDVYVVGAFSAFVLAFSTVGALVASRHPRNPIGWLMCGAAIAYTAGGMTGNYAEYAFGGPAVSLPAARFVAWISTWVWGLGAGLPFLVLLLFPTGSPPSARWRPVVWLTAGGLVLLAAGTALATGPFADYPVDNPLGLSGAGGIVRLLSTAGGFALVGGGLASTGSVLVRFRRARGDERQQLKWLAYAVIVVALSALCSLAMEAAAMAASDQDLLNLSNFLITTALATIPAAVGTAILKYRLYEIDRIISRTATYAVLTAFLGAVYFGVVLLLQAGLGARLADEPLAVAATTLAVAGLFRPARVRIQGAIDRRFNRNRYDAERTVEAFAARLRDEVDIDALTSDLLSVVGKTMQPAQASLWLIGQSAGARREG